MTTNKDLSESLAIAAESLREVAENGRDGNRTVYNKALEALNAIKEALQWSGPGMQHFSVTRDIEIRAEQVEADGTRTVSVQGPSYRSWKVMGDHISEWIGDLRRKTYDSKAREWTGPTGLEQLLTRIEEHNRKSDVSLSEDCQLMDSIVAAMKKKGGS